MCSPKNTSVEFTVNKLEFTVKLEADALRVITETQPDQIFLITCHSCAQKHLA